MIYKQIPQQNEELKSKLDGFGISSFVPGAIILDNPMNTPLSELNARGGFIILDSVQVPARYEILSIEKNKSIIKL